MSEFSKLLTQEFFPYGTLSSLQLEHLEQHYELLQRWNARMNLTRIRRVEDVIRLHYCESLFLGTILPAERLDIADIGSGAGFPGIPLAILRSESNVTLIESHHRKAVFLREASRCLPNIRILPARAENIEEHFDWIVSRAVSPSDVLDLNLAPNIALLIGKDEASQLSDWKVIQVPWGRQRIVALKTSAQCSTWNNHNKRPC